MAPKTTTAAATRAGALSIAVGCVADHREDREAEHDDDAPKISRRLMAWL